MQINKPIVRDLRDILNNVLNDNERLEQFDVHVEMRVFLIRKRHSSLMLK